MNLKISCLVHTDYKVERLCQPMVWVLSSFILFLINDAKFKIGENVVQIYSQ